MGFSRRLDRLGRLGVILRWSPIGMLGVLVYLVEFTFVLMFDMRRLLLMVFSGSYIRRHVQTLTVVAILTLPFIASSYVIPRPKKPDRPT